jgi:hypothetical protein
MAMTYQQLQDAVINYLHRDDVAGLVPTWITLTEQRIYRDIRAPENRNVETGAYYAADESIIASPTLWVQVDSVRDFGGNRPLRPARSQQIIEYRNVTNDAGSLGTQFYRIAGRYPNGVQTDYGVPDVPQTDPQTLLEIDFPGVPQGAGIPDIELRGYRMPLTDLVQSDDLALALLTSYPALFIYGALSEAYHYTNNNDQRVQAEQRYIAELQSVSNADDALEWGTGIQIRPGGQTQGVTIPR